MEKITGVNGEGKKLKGFLCFLLQPGGMLHYILIGGKKNSKLVSLSRSSRELAFCGVAGGFLGKSELDLPRARGVLTEREPSGPCHNHCQKHDSPLVFAANVTLDEATAHPALLVSERGRRVTWQETCQDLPSSTQRFNSIPCVLGQLRINSGRACWEVEVGDMQSWDLGICRDNVTREGVFTMSPQNGFWAIRLYDGDYWALTSPETSLPLRERPLKVGIFLDYEAGDVSFYT
uniref:B30.2/SPRY domain-containing protein n=1 Tax=Sus scrofa TaxID=9823 RepID=A0A4X1TK25_PIG